MTEEIKKMLWASADKLRANMDPAEYKHIVLGLIFLKYISDSFQTHRMQLTLRFQDSATATIATPTISMLPSSKTVLRYVIPEGSTTD
jgi:type I restriction-modification system DNA methylase subunit